jgi:hypothetical protein
MICAILNFSFLKNEQTIKTKTRTIKTQKTQKELLTSWSCAVDRRNVTLRVLSSGPEGTSDRQQFCRALIFVDSNMDFI